MIDSTILPHAWYSFSPLLTQIREYAMSWRVTPQGVYAVLLANAASHIRHGIRTSIGTEPDLWIGNMGRYGCGYTLTMIAAREALPTAQEEIRWGCLSKSAMRERFRDSTEVESIPGFAITADEGIHLKSNFPYVDHVIGECRVTVRESLYSDIFHARKFRSTEAWLQRSARYLLTNILYCPFIEITREADVPSISLTDWSAVPDGPLPAPPAARKDVVRFLSGQGTYDELMHLRMKFSALTAHAALHGRVCATDDDWEQVSLVTDMSKKLLRDVRRDPNWDFLRRRDNVYST